jgi:hypothetical protein
MELFADSDDIRVNFLGGVWIGRQGVKRLYLQRFPERFPSGNPPRHGIKRDDPKYESIVQFSEDWETSVISFRCNIQESMKSQWLGGNCRLES